MKGELSWALVVGVLVAAFWACVYWLVWRGLGLWFVSSAPERSDPEPGADPSDSPHPHPEGDEDAVGGCFDAGGCHGALSWCEHCGDVCDLCDDPECSAHARCIVCDKPVVNSFTRWDDPIERCTCDDAPPGPDHADQAAVQSDVEVS